MIFKVCKICGAHKPRESFNRTSSYCKPCQAVFNREYREKNAAALKAKKAERFAKRTPREKWDHHLRMRYGITAADWERMAAAQRHVCAICEEPPRRLRLSVDHCHKTGQVRRLLCERCNSVLGRVKDSPTILRRAAQYILEHQHGTTQVLGEG